MVSSKNVSDYLVLNKFVKGTDIAKELNVSKMAISKQIKNLRELGWVIESVNNLGYRLIASNDKVDLDFLLANCNKLFTFEHFDSIDSTNNYLKINQSINGRVVIADQQFKGRGRSTKSFYSPSNKGLYFSLLLKPENRFIDLSNLTAIMAVCVKEAIDSLYEIKTSIKWVNDIYLLDKKICGILIEANLELNLQTVESLVIGIGINLYHEDFKDLHDIAGSLEDLTGKRISRNSLLVVILDNIYQAINNLDNPHYLEIYQANSYLDNKIVYLKVNEHFSEILVKGIADDFSLIVIKDGQEIKLSHGELALNFKKD